MVWFVVDSAVNQSEGGIRVNAQDDYRISNPQRRKQDGSGSNKKKMKQVDKFEPIKLFYSKFGVGASVLDFVL